MAANLGEQHANDHIIKTKTKTKTKNILRIIIIIIIRVNYILSLKYKISSI